MFKHGINISSEMEGIVKESEVELSAFESVSYSVISWYLELEMTLWGLPSSITSVQLFVGVGCILPLVSIRSIGAIVCAYLPKVGQHSKDDF